MSDLEKLSGEDYYSEILAWPCSICINCFSLSHSARNKELGNINISIVDHAASFRSNHSCGEFLNNNIIMSGHDDRSTKIPGDMKQKLHDLIGSFRIKVSGRFIG